MQENLSSGVCKQQKRRPVCTSVRRLISAFVIHFLERIISKLAIGEISIFQLVSVAEHAGLNLTSLET